MLEFTSQSIACEIPALQELWNAQSQVYSIPACGWAFRPMQHCKTRCGRTVRLIVMELYKSFPAVLTNWDFILIHTESTFSLNTHYVF